MPTSETSIVERIARVVAAFKLSGNADGAEPHAATSVDIEWESCVDEALAILKVMREPDQAMARAGSAEAWEAMILAALTEADLANPLAPPVNIGAA